MGMLRWLVEGIEGLMDTAWNLLDTERVGCEELSRALEKMQGGDATGYAQNMTGDRGAWTRSDGRGRSCTSHNFTPKQAAMAANERGVSGAGCYKTTGRAYTRP
jgi:hypothetical protein